MVKKGGQTISFLFEFNTFIGQYWLQTHDNYPKDLRFVIGGKTTGNGGMPTSKPAVVRWATPNLAAEHTIIQTHNVLKSKHVVPFINI